MPGGVRNQAFFGLAVHSSCRSEGEREAPFGGGQTGFLFFFEFASLSSLPQEYSVGEAIGEGAFGVVYARS